MKKSQEFLWNDRARERMSELGISQAALAKSLGVVRAAVSHYISGRTEPSLSHFMLICRHLQVSSDWLLFGGANSPLPVPSEASDIARKIGALDATARRDIEGFIRVKASAK